MQRIVMTVCYLICYGRILLGLKKVRLGEGLYNGFGGRQEPGEPIDVTAEREYFDESGLRLIGLRRLGVMLITRQWSFSEEVELHIYRADGYEGTLRESDEMRPKWFSLEKIPYSQMWASDWHFLPIVLEDRHFMGKVHLHDFHTIISIELAVDEPASDQTSPEE